MNLLLDFLNVEDWTVEKLLILFKEHQIWASIAGRKQGYESNFMTKFFVDTFFFLEDSSFYMSLKESGVSVVAPWDISGYSSFFVYFNCILQEWHTRISYTIEHGPDIDFLNKNINIAKFKMQPGENPWDVQLSYYETKHVVIEDILILDYVRTFLKNNGHVFKKLKRCENCNHWFRYDRSTKKYCTDDCRLKANNRKKIESGALARFMKKKRDEGNAIYFPK